MGEVSESRSRVRAVARVVPSERHLEGAGFEVRRPFPTRALDHYDPFLLLDEMGPMDLGPGQAKGAPDHPHRGFETVTYVLAGRMQHKDSAGHAGTIGPGDVQWMTAGAGVVHSEMPDGEILRHGGRMHGFQLWVNLPRRDKLMAPRYQEIPGDGIPEAESADGRVRVRVIAGESLGQRAVIDTRTPIAYLHVTLQPGGELEQPLPASWNAIVYPFVGGVSVGPQGGAGQRDLAEGDTALLPAEGAAAGSSGAAGPAASILRVALPKEAAGPSQLLILAGEPLREPVARYGPFVMTTRDELVRAFEDYQAGRMGRIA